MKENKPSLYKLIGLDDDASLASVKKQLAKIDAGEADDAVSESNLKLAANILADPGSKLAYDLLLEGIRRIDGMLTPIRDKERIETLQRLSELLGLRLKCLKPGLYQIFERNLNQATPEKGALEESNPDVIADPVFIGDPDSFALSDFYGADLEFTSTKFVAQPSDLAKSTTVVADRFEPFTFSNVIANRPSPFEPGDRGSLLYVKSQRLRCTWTPIAYLKVDLDGSGVLFRGARELIGSDSSHVAIRFGLRDRPSKIRRLLVDFVHVLGDAMAHFEGQCFHEQFADGLKAFPSEFHQEISRIRIPLVFD
ncbi:MAG: hypothetical protein AAF497_14120 [Planctomycetota bacterium]